MEEYLRVFENSGIIFSHGENLHLGKNKKNITSLSSAELVKSMVKVKKNEL